MFNVPEHDIFIENTNRFTIKLSPSRYNWGADKRLHELFCAENGLDKDEDIPNGYLNADGKAEINVPIGTVFKFTVTKTLYGGKDCYTVALFKKHNPNSEWNFFTQKLKSGCAPVRIQMTAQEFNNCGFVKVNDD